MKSVEEREKESKHASRGKRWRREITYGRATIEKGLEKKCGRQKASYISRSNGRMEEESKF